MFDSEEGVTCWRRLRRKTTSRHQAILVDGSLAGFCMMGRACVRDWIEGSGAVRAGDLGGEDAGAGAGGV